VASAIRRRGDIQDGAGVAGARFRLLVLELSGLESVCRPSSTALGGEIARRPARSGNDNAGRAGKPEESGLFRCSSLGAEELAFPVALRPSETAGLEPDLGVDCRDRVAGPVVPWSLAESLPGAEPAGLWTCSFAFSLSDAVIASPPLSSGSVADPPSADEPLDSTAGGSAGASGRGFADSDGSVWSTPCSPAGSTESSGLELSSADVSAGCSPVLPSGAAVSPEP
jgi:hypothetical protein